jgi:hypothetical protein
VKPALDAHIPTASLAAVPSATADLRYEMTDRRLSRTRSTAALVALCVSLLAPGTFPVMLVLHALGVLTAVPAVGEAYVGVMIGGPPAGLILGVTALLLRPRRHFWAAIVATCLSAPMLLFSIFWLVEVLR